MDGKVAVAVVVGLFVLVCWSAWKARSRELKSRELQSPLLVPKCVRHCLRYALCLYFS